MRRGGKWTITCTEYPISGSISSYSFLKFSSEQKSCWWPTCWCLGLGRSASSFPRSLAKHSHCPTMGSPGVPFKGSGWSLDTSDGTTEHQPGTESYFPARLGNISFSICRITDVDVWSPPLSLWASDQWWQLFHFFFAFPIKRKKSEGLRKVVQILEELHTSYWGE